MVWPPGEEEVSDLVSRDIGVGELGGYSRSCEHQV